MSRSFNVENAYYELIALNSGRYSLLLTIWCGWIASNTIVTLMTTDMVFRLTCTLSMQFEHARGCTVSAEGQLGTHGPLRIFYIHSTTDKAIDSASTHGARSRSTR